MSGHTPGPWKLKPGHPWDYGPERKPGAGYIMPPPAVGTVGAVAEVYLSLADAQLIASAPELLEACERALRLLDHDLCGPIETVELLKSAIKKAKGGGL